MEKVKAFLHDAWLWLLALCIGLYKVIGWVKGACASREIKNVQENYREAIGDSDNSGIVDLFNELR